MKPLQLLSTGILLCAGFSTLPAQIPVPTDAPAPLSPNASARQVQLPPGFRFELVASEPLVREPSGVCWDAHGRLFVSELHGYNLEGQYDIDDLNKTGKLDREVRRIQANPRAKKAAMEDTFGTIKLLSDTDGDGRMDHATVFADRLPPCYGVCPARDGIIVACAPDIVFLADRDGDGRAEVRETLFTGFDVGALERGINAPQWGLDDWIYIGSGHGGGNISGPNLPQPVRIGNTDFRIKADGSAIEPIVGGTHTFGHAFGEFGERFVVTTSQPGRYVAPIPWRYLARNPDAAAPRLEQSAANYSRAYPVAPPHPWRTRRAQDPGFYKYYRDRYGAGDSEAGGYFTSGCGPLVYQDVALPPEFRGAYFFCEPAQNLVHRAVIKYNGPEIRLERAPGEEESEFLASGDQWFHPMNLLHGPEGAIYIVDLYREIIEDYSAIPRYLQQQYGLTNGIAHGRIWRLTHQDAPTSPPFDMSNLSPETLATETVSPHYWRRQTARRLLLEQNQAGIAPALSRLLNQPQQPGRLLNAFYTLDGLNAIQPSDVTIALTHSSPGIRLHGLRFAERFLQNHPAILGQVLALADDENDAVKLQLALTLGESRDPRTLSTLARLIRQAAAVRWMPNAVLSSVAGRAGELFAELVRDTGNLGSATPLLEPLCQSIAARRDPLELTRAIGRLGTINDADLLRPCLSGFHAGLKGANSVSISAADRISLSLLLTHANPEIRRLATDLLGVFLIVDPEERKKMLTQSSQDAADLKLPAPLRLAAVHQLAGARDAEATAGLLAAWPANTPRIREAIFDAIFQRRERLPAMLDALEKKSVSAAALTAFQRVTLLEHENAEVRRRAAALFSDQKGPDDATFQRFAAGLANDRNTAHGEQVFREHCASCHKTRGIGFEVGPDLAAEFQRAEEAILLDILAPNDVISAGYATYVVETKEGQTFNGVLSGESATSVTLRQPASPEQVILKKDIERISTLPVSLMPEALVQALQPRDVADAIAWLQDVDGDLKRNTGRKMLFDDETDFVAKLKDGGGQATVETEDAFAGKAYLAVTPLQRHSVNIPGWNYRIAEQPGPGEFRYLRLAWRTRGGDGVLVELAADGRWPAASDASRRYYAGRNTTAWMAHAVSPLPPTEWRVVTLDLWKDNGAFTLTGIAPTAMGGVAHFDRIELIRDLRAVR